MTHPNTAACLMGALVADAAALGLHWIYDPARIDAVAQAQGAAFVPLNSAHFQGVPAYFAHGARRDGALTQYGEVLALTLRSIAAKGHFDIPAYQSAYQAHFGPGGAYVGYIDRVTRGTLANLAAGQVDPSGIDDDQLPAVASLPAIVVANLGSNDLPADVAKAIRVTNVNDTAQDYGMAFATLLALVLEGQNVKDALHSIAENEQGSLGDSLRAALADTGTSTDYGEITGRACHLPMALPLCFHILARAASFADATEANIRAGGDSAGRAIVIGAVMGAAHAMGDAGIPTAYLLQIQDAAALWHSCQTVAALAAK